MPHTVPLIYSDAVLPLTTPSRRQVRLYHVVAKVTTRFGVKSNAALKGDVIYFPHDAPDVVARTLEERVDWVRNGEFRVALVGPDGERDNLARWLRERSVVSARPIVCYNHLAIRAAIDTVMDNCDEHGKPKITEVPNLEVIKAQLDGLSESLLDRARHMSGDDALRVEEGQQAAADDITNTREQGDSLGRVALLSSSSTCCALLWLVRNARCEVMRRVQMARPQMGLTVATRSLIRLRPLRLPRSQPAERRRSTSLKRMGCI